MNTAHRLADGFRSVISYWTPTPSKSQFIEKGTLTPQEFVEAGDQLTFKFPTWRWERADTRHQVSWLPPDKQYLATYGVRSRCRVKDLDKCVPQEYLGSCQQETNDAWLLPASPTEDSHTEEVSLSNISHSNENVSQHPLSEQKQLKEQSVDGETSASTSTKQVKELLPDIVCFSEIDDILNADEDSVTVGNRLLYQSHTEYQMTTRSYDLSVTYDKYYQTPRLWLKGYNESGLPLGSSEIFEDILTDYISKTVTFDPHPCTGDLTVSIHPCKHASVMKKVVHGWISHGVRPRHDLALVVLLKFISSVIPTIQYDTTVDIDGFSLS